MNSVRLLAAVLTLVISLHAPAQTWLTNDLVAYYPFNGDASDQSGNGNHTAPGGNYAFATNGLSGGALRTTGDNSSFYSGGGHALLPTFSTALNAGFTLSLWAKNESVGGSPFNEEAYITFGALGLTIAEILLNATVPAVQFILANSSGGSTVNYPINLQTYSNSWKHLAMTYTPGKMTAYLDGQKVGETNITYNIFPVSKAGLARHWWAGGASSSARLSSLIDNVRIYSRSLSSSEIQQLYFAESSTALTNGLVAFYPFNGNADDESGYGHHAFVMGSGTQLTSGVNGEPNSAYRCAPGNNFIQGSGINLSNSSLSITLWFQKDYTNYNAFQHGGLVRLGELGPAGGQTGKSLHIQVNYNGAPSLRFSFFSDDFVVATPVGNGNWSHIACTFDSVTRERRIYVDGSLIATNIAVRGYSGGSNFDFNPGGLGGGFMDQVRFYNRALSSNEVRAVYILESDPSMDVVAGPRVDLIKAAKPVFNQLLVGIDYQLQVSGDLLTWTNHGSPFTATDTNMVFPQYWDMDNWAGLSFRLQVTPQ